MQKGKASISFERPPILLTAASIVGEKEGEGPLAQCFDRIEPDPMLGKDSWEEAESELQRQTAKRCLKKAGLKEEDIRYLFAGDLLGQIVATSFGTEELGIPFFGLYGACSTMGEAMMLGAMTVNAGYADRVMSMASSHFGSAERQFRFPLAYGNQRPLSTTWTVTGCGSVILAGEGICRKKIPDDFVRNKMSAEENSEQFMEVNSKQFAETNAKKFAELPEESHFARITGVTTGKIVDMQLKDSMNMGAAMAVAAVDTILQNFRDFGIDQTYYDKIITGDLGAVGQNILFDFMDQAGYDVRGIHMDCGMVIYDSASQDTHSGGSGCGCAAVTLCGYILPKLKSGEWKRVLFVPTGALLSQISFNEGQSVPGIAHAVMLEHIAP